ncbi:mog-2, partial [Pristionchus pacificus]
GSPLHLAAAMVRMSVELLAEAHQYINTVKERELNLRNFKIPVIENMGVTQDQFDYIDMSDNDVKKLDNFPLLKRLQALYLHNNRVQFISSNLGESLPKLKTLTLTNNNLCELGDIDGLATCEKLEYLTLIGNPITHKPHYRSYVIFKLPQVRVLDFKRIRLAEREEAKKQFKGKKNAKKRAEVAKHSEMPVDELAAELEKSGVRGGSRIVNEEDKQKIKDAIKNAKNLVEIEYLQQILASGRIPEKGWNRQMDLTEKTNGAEPANGEFQAEEEEAMEQ